MSSISEFSDVYVACVLFLFHFFSAQWHHEIEANKCHRHEEGFHIEKFFGKTSDKNTLLKIVCGNIFDGSVTVETMGDEALKACFAHVIALSEVDEIFW